MLRTIFLLICITLILPSVSQAEKKTLYVDHKYVMGDNESKNDARRLCLFEAKRMIAEKAGTYIESRTHVLNLEATKDEIFLISYLPTWERVILLMLWWYRKV
jgi:hypothetical protein